MKRFFYLFLLLLAFAGSAVAQQGVWQGTGSSPESLQGVDTLQVIERGGKYPVGGEYLEKPLPQGWNDGEFFDQTMPPDDFMILATASSISV